MTEKEGKTAENTKKLTLGAVLTALSLVLGYVETLLPFSFGLPGAKIGLANLGTLLSLYLLGPVPAFLIGLSRIILSAFLFTSLSALLYSAAGFLVSFSFMVLLKRSGKFGITAVSAIGGVTHNLGQLLAAVLAAGTGVLPYFPYLFACGTVAGIFIGLLGKLLYERLLPVLGKNL